MNSITQINGDIVFDAKPDAVPYNYRISYKVSQLCLLMHVCGWGGSCSLIKIHMIAFSLLSHTNALKLLDFVQGKGVSPIVRFDPAINRALTFAVAYGFINQIKTGNFKLTESGKKLAEQILLAGDIMICELETLNSLGKTLSETKIDELEKQWRGWIC